MAAAAGVLIFVLLFNALYQVQPEEVGVVLRLGRFVGTSEPGLRAKIPLVEDVRKASVQRQLKEEFGFRTVDPGVRTVYSPADFDDEAIMLTGDLNVAVMEGSSSTACRIRIWYLFKVRNLTDTFRAMNEAVTREVVGDRTVTEVLTIRRQEFGPPRTSSSAW